MPVFVRDLSPRHEIGLSCEPCGRFTVRVYPGPIPGIPAERPVMDLRWRCSRCGAPSRTHSVDVVRDDGSNQRERVDGP